MGERRACTDDLGGFRCDFSGENLCALLDRMNLRALNGRVFELRQLGFASDQLVLQLGYLLELDSGLPFGVEHLLFIAISREGEGGVPGPLFSGGNLGGGELDQVLSGPAVEVVDEFLTEFEEGFVDPVGVLGAESADG